MEKTPMDLLKEFAPEFAQHQMDGKALLFENTCKEVVDENNLDANIEKVTDMNEFGEYGVMITPGLVVNGKVLSQGKIPVKSTLEGWLKDASN